MTLAREASAAGPHARPGTPRRLKELYREHVIEKGREPRFLIALSYLITLGVVRFITHSIRNHWFRFLFHDMGSSAGGHLHHFALGILGMMAAAYIAIAFSPRREWVRRILAIVFGISAGLIIDEFALWLTFKDVYWSAQGRASVDAAFILGSLVTIVATGRGLLGAIGHDLQELVGDGRPR